MSLEKTEEVTAAVLFSGGRDSSLATCLLARSGYKLHLLTYLGGMQIGVDISNYRVEELKRTFPENIVGRFYLNSCSLFRKIGLVDLVKDVRLYRNNLLPMAECLAGSTEAIIYCKKNNIKHIASGFTRYESNLMEQMDEVIPNIKEFFMENGIEYLTPVIDYCDIDEVKYDLLSFGITTKSLEGLYLWGDPIPVVKPEVVNRYIKAKLPICRSYIKFRLNK